MIWNYTEREQLVQGGYDYLEKAEAHYTLKEWAEARTATQIAMVCIGLAGHLLEEARDGN